MSPGRRKKSRKIAGYKVRKSSTAVRPPFGGGPEKAPAESGDCAYMWVKAWPGIGGDGINRAQCGLPRGLKSTQCL